MMGGERKRVSSSFIHVRAFSHLRLQRTSWQFRHSPRLSGHTARTYTKSSPTKDNAMLTTTESVRYITTKNVEYEDARTYPSCFTIFPSDTDKQATEIVGYRPCRAGHSRAVAFEALESYAATSNAKCRLPEEARSPADVGSCWSWV
jgi:hypothetical protein